MPFCPKCEFEYRPGITKCPDCAENLVAELALDSTRDIPHPEPAPWVKLGVLADEAEAEIVKGLLESEGIPVTVNCDVITWSGLRLQSAVPAGEKAIMVPQSRLEEAVRLLEAYRQE